MGTKLSSSKESYLTVYREGKKTYFEGDEHFLQKRPVHGVLYRLSAWHDEK